MEQVKQDEGRYLLLGRNFTDYSRVFINGIKVSSRLLSDRVIEIGSGSLQDGDKITIHQVSETNEKIVLNKSDTFIFHREEAEPLYKNKVE